MGDMMTFPASVEEFMEQYKMTDTEHVYSNGTEYVPIYRMKQWFEHCRHQQFPAADVATVRHGRWVQVIVHVEFEDGFVDRVEECCSACHEPNGRRCTYFCPNCGAKMEE